MKKKMFIFMVIGLMNSVGAYDDINEPPYIHQPWGSVSGPGYGGRGGDGGSLPGLPGGKGGYGGYPDQRWRSRPSYGGRRSDGGYYNSPSIPRQPRQSWQGGYEDNLYWYCLGLAKASIKRRWRDYISSDDHMHNYSPLYCKRFANSPRKLLKNAKKRQARSGRDGPSYYGGYGGRGGRAGRGPGAGRGGRGGAGIAGGRGGKGGRGGSAY
jgi:hypothetical protein